MIPKLNSSIPHHRPNFAMEASDYAPNTLITTKILGVAQQTSGGN
jgi:hypothetical protein